MARTYLLRLKDGSERIVGSEEAVDMMRRGLPPEASALVQGVGHAALRRKTKAKMEAAR